MDFVGRRRCRALDEGAVNVFQWEGGTTDKSYSDGDESKMDPYVKSEMSICFMPALRVQRSCRLTPYDATASVRLPPHHYPATSWRPLANSSTCSKVRYWLLAVPTNSATITATRRQSGDSAEQNMCRDCMADEPQPATRGLSAISPIKV